MTLRILHLSTTDIQGGAARGAYWLHRALGAAGVESLMLVDRKYSDDETVLAPANGGKLIRRLRAYADALPLIRYDRTDESFWSINWVPTRMGRLIRAIDPDIVHLHWSGGGFVPIQQFKSFGVPVVWTLRDMWPFTGGCHYTAGCERYRTGCGRCPQLRSASDDDLSRHVFERKQAHWRAIDLWLVPISSWLADAARRSPLFEDTPMEVIPNGVDLERFQPAGRMAARRAWNLPEDRRLILFGALNATTDRRKGYDELRRAVAILSKSGWRDRAELVVFGADGGDDREALGLNVRYVGHLRDDARLALLYSAADVMVTPSLQEAFGKTLIEAMACATPVVAFDSGGPSDIVEHRRTGYLARPFDPESLAAGIAWCLDGTERVGELGRAARARALSHYGIDRIAGLYCNLYRRIEAQARCAETVVRAERAMGASGSLAHD
jgi:glycosyltransferase involved in cell wall biosynthesis